MDGKGNKKFFYYKFHGRLREKGYDSCLGDDFYRRIEALKDIYSENLLRITGGRYNRTGIHKIYVEDVDGIPLSKIEEDNIISLASTYQKFIWISGILNGLDKLRNFFGTQANDLRLGRESILFTRDKEGYYRPRIVHYWEEFLDEDIRDIRRIYSEPVETDESDELNEPEETYESDPIYMMEYMYRSRWSKGTDYRFDNIRFLFRLFDLTPGDEEERIPLLYLKLYCAHDYRESIRILNEHLREHYSIRICIPGEVRGDMFRRAGKSRYGGNRKIRNDADIESYIENVGYARICMSKVKLWREGKSHYTLYMRSKDDIDAAEEVVGYTYMNAVREEDDNGTYLEVCRFGYLKPDQWWDSAKPGYILPAGVTIDESNVGLEEIEGEVRANERNLCIRHMNETTEKNLLDIWCTVNDIYIEKVTKEYDEDDEDDEGDKDVEYKAMVDRRNRNLRDLMKKDKVPFHRHGKLLYRMVTPYSWLREILTRPDRYYKELSQDNDADVPLIDRIIAARDIFALWGPPGTGKTRTIKELVDRIMENDCRTRILLSTQDNVALRHLFKMFDLEDKMILSKDKEENEDAYSKVKNGIRDKAQKKLDELEEQEGKLRSEYEKNLENRKSRERYDRDAGTILALNRQILESRSDEEIEWLCYKRERYLDDMLLVSDMFEENDEDREKVDNYLKVRKRIAVLCDWINMLDDTAVVINKAIIMNHHLVAITCNKVANYLEFDRFDWVIIDEAAKIDPLDLLIAMNRGKKVVLVGDHNQLRPQLEEDLFDHYVPEEQPYEHAVKFKPVKKQEYLEKLPFRYFYEHLPDSNKGVLSGEYRMCGPICDFVSSVFYGGMITPARKTPRKRFTGIYKDYPLLWLSTSRMDNRYEKKEGKSRINLCEAGIVWDCIEDIYAHSEDQDLSVMVITGYKAQEILINNNKVIKVGTVDAFQGQEADVVLVSVVRSNKEKKLGFFDDMSRINVAFSRARDQLIIIGDSDFFFESNKKPYAEKIREFFVNNEAALIDYDYLR